MRTLVVILSLFLIAAQNGRDWQFGSTTLDVKTFANLGTENDGQVKWCPDCQSTNPCLGGGNGAYAFGRQSEWNCSFSTGPLASCAQLPALTGDVTSSAGSCAVTVDGAVGHSFAADAFCADISGHDCSAPPFTAPWFYDNTGGLGNSGGIVYSNGPLTNLGVTGGGGTGTVLKAGPPPSFGPPPVHFVGGANAVVSTTVENVIPLEGVDAPVATTAEGSVLIEADAAFSTLTLTCIGVNAGGVATSPSPGTYALCLRNNRANTTQCCTLSSQLGCNNSTSQTVVVRNLLDVDVVPSATAPTALIIKCELTGK